MVKKTIVVLAPFAAILLLAAAPPTLPYSPLIETMVQDLVLGANFPPQPTLVGGTDSSGNRNINYVDSAGNVHITTTSPLPVSVQGVVPLPDAGNLQVPADQANTQVKPTLVLVGTSATAMPTTPLVGRKWVALTNNGPTPIYCKSLNTVTGPSGGVNQGGVIAAGQEKTIPMGSNVAYYCACDTAQVTPTTGVPNGTLVEEGQ